MKKFILLSAVSASALAFSQSGNVGINTSTPAATLDVVGQPGTAAKLDGIIAPRLSGAQLRAKTYTSAQNGALIYATDADTAPAGQTINVTSVGYYYFDAIANQWKAMNATAPEPWYNQATNQPATVNTQNIYQTGRVSVNGNNSTGILSVTDNIGNSNTAIIYGSFKNPTTGTNPWFGFFENLNGGSWSSLTNKNDMAFVFNIDNNASTLTNNGFEFLPHIGGVGAVYAGWKITEQGMTGINAQNPTENLDIAGTTRIRQLPLNGSANAIYTTPGGTNSLAASITTVPAPTQLFTATKTVVADANGVLGYVAGIPGAAAISAKSGLLTTADFTVLATGNISLPTASAANGKIFNIVYNGTTSQITSSIQINGAPVANYTLNGSTGGSGVSVQSDGANWYLISRY